jgi:hypothetical protein
VIEADLASPHKAIVAISRQAERHFAFRPPSRSCELLTCRTSTAARTLHDDTNPERRSRVRRPIIDAVR